MNQELKSKLTKVKTLISNEDKEKDIIELSDKIGNRVLIEYLEIIGSGEIEYIVDNSSNPGYMKESGGKVSLWHKNMNGIWTILNWQIKRLLKETE
ncbi:hypothetical protein HZY62_21535 [Maribacter polysiphoniae]|uniref:Uncharacterized protein n=1 Tax=Maribacter polysiphoniae TaxID=429344 RepID=A0A316E688_9FLAO|nr:hypothetical protein [Maribacter polysiphoniae]MBD1263184.1 hypothetical protein [Maribacter polysiphoniae]PWK18450.1 hypothetical protein LX92_04324 [Maribacter polysiphoniae]